MCMTQETAYQALINAIEKSELTYQTELLRRAFEFANKAHQGQMRATGEPYIIHPVNVAVILMELGMDSESIVAALLHDVVEDTGVSLEELEKEFGAGIAQLVDGVTKIGKIPYSSREEEQAENLRKMLIAMSEDIRVIIIKLADRLHNLRTIDAKDPQKRRDKALETLEVYAPIAHRLGIRAIKEELEDISISQLDPIGYQTIVQALDERQKDRQTFLQYIKEQIRDRLSQEYPEVHLEGRVKSTYGIYRKMYMQGKGFDEIYDIYAVRVIVNTVTECYNVLGIIHDMFRSIPGRFKDYISTPKANVYQSLHTTILSRQGIPFEIQIRTWDMHYNAEYGIAAHWKYKDGIHKNDKQWEGRLAWIRQLLDNQKDAGNVEEIVQTIKNDLTQDDVFVVSPKGDIIILPLGSTVIDFAYAIHSAVGNRMVGAKVDGKIVPIDYQVRTGEVVEILTSQQVGKGPSRDWLNIVHTSEARNKIRSWFKKEERPENIERGRTEFERELKRNYMRFQSEEVYNQFLDRLRIRYRCNSADDFYAMIGYGGLQLTNLLPRIKEDYNKYYKPVPSEEEIAVLKKQASPVKNARSQDGITIKGIDNCLIKLSRCCSPLPGDDIVGFITRGHGVSIHKRDCTNVPSDLSLCEEPERWVEALWNHTQRTNFKAVIDILAIDRPQFLLEVTQLIANMNVTLHAVSAREIKGGNCSVTLTVSVDSLTHLNNVIAKMRKIRDVLTVERGNQ